MTAHNAEPKNLTLESRRLLDNIRGCLAWSESAEHHLEKLNSRLITLEHDLEQAQAVVRVLGIKLGNEG